MLPSKLLAAYALPLTLTLAAVLVSGCAPPEEEPVEESAGAFSRSSGLAAGTYDGKSISLSVYGDPRGKGQLVDVFASDGTAVAMSNVEVSLLGSVTLSDDINNQRACRVAVEPNGDRVDLKGDCAGRTISETVTRRKVSALVGSFACEGPDKTSFLLTILSANETAIRVRAEARSAKAPFEGTVEVGWSEKAASFSVKGAWNFSAPRVNRATWSSTEPGTPVGGGDGRDPIRVAPPSVCNRTEPR